MTLEIAIFDITEGDEDRFATAYGRGRAVLAAADGCHDVRMVRGIESPSRFVLLVEWTSVAAHEAFRSSDAFTEWRGHVGPFFAAPPVVEHFADVDGDA